MNIEIKKTSQIVSNGDNSIADVTMDTPLFSDDRASKRLRRYYQKAESSFIDQFKKLPGPLSVPVSVSFTVTHNENDLISLYRDISIGNNHTRIADTWKNGYPVSIKALGVKKRDIMRKCTEEAEILERSGYIALFPTYHRLIRKKYRPECFYIQDGKIIVFYEAGVLTGKSHGIIKFSIS